MKKKLLFPHSAINRRLRIIFFILWIGVCSSPETRATGDLDRQYKLETIGYLRAWDNVDGLFADYISLAYKDFFSHQSRFVVNDLTQGNSLLMKSKIPYLKIILDRDVLGQLARSTGTESILRTRIIQEGNQYSVVLDWLHSPHMELMGTETFLLEGTQPLNSETISELIHSHLNQLISKIPFIGNVTGRDQESVTVNLGSRSALKQGDTLMISTLDAIKKHPLTQSIVEWKLSPTGKLKVEQIEDSMAFCKIAQEEPGKEISRYQKVVSIRTNPEIQISDLSSPPEMELKHANNLPQLGWVGTTIWSGIASRQYSTPSISPQTGGGFILGGKVDSEVWLTQEFFANLGFSYAFWNFTQQDTLTGIQTPISQMGGIGSSVLGFKLDLGYSYQLTEELLGPKGWLKVGYKSNGYSLPVSATERTGPISFSSLFVGIGGELPILGNWGISTNFNFGIFPFVSQNWISDTVSSLSDVEFYLGGYYRLTTRIIFRAGLEIQANGIDFTHGTSLNQKTMTFAPSVLYYF